MKSDYTIILAVVLFLNVAAMLFLGHLISFHVYLKKVGMTTFEYIPVSYTHLTLPTKRIV